MPLTPEQQAAVTSTAPRIALLAAPGSGKTRVLTERAARLLLEGYHPSELLLVTFTRKAAAEMRERIVARMEGTGIRGVRKLAVTTFHALGSRILREWADVLGLDPRFTIRGEDDAADLWLYVGEELGLFEGKKPTAAMTARGRKTRARSVAKRLEAQEAYDRHMQEAQAVDYDGLQRKLLALLRIPDVARQLRKRWPHVLVDETQDTSEQQQAILDALDPDNLFVVGDVSQCIYGFRGAHPAGFVALTERDDWTLLKLTTNFRSKAPIVDAATRLGQAMAVPGLDQTPGRLDAHDDAEHALKTLDLPGGIEVWAPFFIASLRQVREHLGCGWSGCAVLSPTWRELERLQEHLEAAGIPCDLSRRSGDVWASDSMRWLVDGLRVVVNPHDYLSLYGYLNRLSLRVNIGRWAQTRATALREGRPVLQAACAIGGAAGGMAAALLPLQEADTGFLPAVRLVAAALEGRVRAEHLDSRVDELAACVKAVEAWAAEQEEPPTIQSFLDARSEELVAPGADDEEEAPGAVTLSTIHGAKGLEWPAVWLLACEEGALPRSKEPGDSMEEERRLFYVGMTRGEERVRLVWRGNRERSRFVGEALGADSRAEAAK